MIRIVFVQFFVNNFVRMLCVYQAASTGGFSSRPEGPDVSSTNFMRARFHLSRESQYCKISVSPQVLFVSQSRPKSAGPQEFLSHSLPPLSQACESEMNVLCADFPLRSNHTCVSVMQMRSSSVQEHTCVRVTKMCSLFFQK